MFSWNCILILKYSWDDFETDLPLVDLSVYSMQMQLIWDSNKRDKLCRWPRMRSNSSVVDSQTFFLISIFKRYHKYFETSMLSFSDGRAETPIECIYFDYAWLCNRVWCLYAHCAVCTWFFVWSLARLIKMSLAGKTIRGQYMRRLI